MNSEALVSEMDRRLRRMHKDELISKLGVKQVRSVVRTAIERNDVDVDTMFDVVAERTGISERSKSHIRTLLDELFVDSVERPEMSMNTSYDSSIQSRDIREGALSDEVDEVNRDIADVLERTVYEQAVTPIEQKYREMLTRFRAEGTVLRDMADMLDRYKPRHEGSWRDELQFA